MHTSRQFIAILLILTLLPVLSITAQSQEVTAAQWQVTDIGFSTRKVPADPFEVTFGAILEVQD